MIFDKTLLLSDAQAVTADAASTNVLDLGATGTPLGASAALLRDLGKGECVPLDIQVVEPFNNLTSLGVQVQVADDEAFTTPVVLWSRTYALAELTAGKVVNLREIPMGANKRYLRLFYDLTGTAPTTGKITAGVVAAVQTNGVAV